MKVGGIKTRKELMIGVQLLVRLLLDNNLFNPDLSFKDNQMDNHCLLKAIKQNNFQILSYFSFNYSAGDFLSGSEVFSFHD